MLCCLDAPPFSAGPLWILICVQIAGSSLSSDSSHTLAIRRVSKQWIAALKPRFIPLPTPPPSPTNPTTSYFQYTALMLTEQERTGKETRHGGAVKQGTNKRRRSAICS